MYNYFTIKRNEETGELEYSHNYNDKDNEIDEDRFNYFSRIYDIPKPDLNEL